MINKKATEMPFNWIFAIIAGAIILFLGIYITTKLINTSNYDYNTQSAERLVLLLDPLEAGLASGTSELIEFKKQTEVFCECQDWKNPPFGGQSLSFSEKILGNEFSEKGGEIPIKNKYVFMENSIKSKKLNVISKTFFMPFKISDLIIIFSGDYYFYQAPNEIKEDINSLNLKNIYFIEDLNEFESSEGTLVCFSSNINSFYDSCNIMIKGECLGGNCEHLYERGKVIKNNQELSYFNNLIYGAIFSSKEIYECNLKRLIKRFIELKEIYLNKLDLIQRLGCGAEIRINLQILENSVENFNDSNDLITLFEHSKKIDQMNQNTISGCKLY